MFLTRVINLCDNIYLIQNQSIYSDYYHTPILPYICLFCHTFYMCIVEVQMEGTNPVAPFKIFWE